MNGGFCNITIIRPNGKIISVNSTVINGNLTSNLISTSGWKEGTGSITIFWTDGSAFGYSKFTFSMTKISFPWAILLSIIIGIIITVPTSLYVLRKLEERNWEKSLLYIFGLTKEGGSLFGKTFRIDLQDPALISGMIAAITNFVTETMKSKKALRVIDHEDKKVILSHGPNYIIALMAEKDLNIIRKAYGADAIGIDIQIQNNDIIADGRFLCFKDNTFDAVIAITTLAFVREEEKMLKEIWRVLKNNGKLLLLLYNNSPSIFLRKILKISGAGIWTPDFYGGYRKFHNMNEITSLLKSLNFRIEIAYYTNFAVLLLNRFPKFVEWVFRNESRISKMWIARMIAKRIVVIARAEKEKDE